MVVLTFWFRKHQEVEWKILYFFFLTLSPCRNCQNIKNYEYWSTIDQTMDFKLEEDLFYSIKKEIEDYSIQLWSMIRLLPAIISGGNEKEKRNLQIELSIRTIDVVKVWIWTSQKIVFFTLFKINWNQLLKMMQIDLNYFIQIVRLTAFSHRLMFHLRRFN